MIYGNILTDTYSFLILAKNFNTACFSPFEVLGVRFKVLWVGD